MGFLIGLVVVVAVVVIAVLLVINIYGSLYRKVGPNKALIVYGSGKMRVLTGGGELVVPIFRQAQEISLELMSFDVVPQQDLYTNQGVPVRVEAVTQLKIRSDEQSILTAAEQFLSMTDEERVSRIRLVMEGHLRGIVGQLTVEQLIKEPEMVGEKMRMTSSADLAKMGLEVVSFTIIRVSDEHDYINTMSVPETQRVLKEAEIARALATRDATVARANADRETTEKQTASETQQAEYRRDLEIRRAQFEAEVQTQQVIAEKARELQLQIQQQQILDEATKAQAAESKRRAMELDATVVRVAEASRQRAVKEAEARAAAIRAEAEAEAESIRIRGEAQASVIRAQGQAQADAMRMQADAYREYNQAAVLDKVITNLPEMVRAIAEPLSKVDKISIVSTGAGNSTGLGADRITGDMVRVLAQVPAILEALTGTRLGDLMAAVPAMSANGHTAASSSSTVAADPSVAGTGASGGDAVAVAVVPAPAAGAEPAIGGAPTIALDPKIVSGD